MLCHRQSAAHYPKWLFQIQLMTEEEADNYRINPFDLTKVWPHKDFPLQDVGVLELNRNPENYLLKWNKLLSTR